MQRVFYLQPYYAVLDAIMTSRKRSSTVKKVGLLHKQVYGKRGILRSQCKDSCMKRRCLQRVSTDLLDKANHLTAFCAWNSSPMHLLVNPVQLTRPGVGWNVSCAGVTLHNMYAYFFGEMWFVDGSTILRARTYLRYIFWQDYDNS